MNILELTVANYALKVLGTHYIKSNLKSITQNYYTFRNISQHMRNVHFLDWEQSQCLKCLTYEENRDELIAHCLSCFKDEVGHEFKSEFDVSDNIDPDYEPEKYVFFTSLWE